MLRSGWRGIALIGVVYVYFLIFAQFAFLARLAALGIGGSGLKAVMAAMAAGGIALSLLTPRVRLAAGPALRMRVGLGLCAAAAALSLAALNVFAAAAVALLIGAGLGVTTVTLVTYLDGWMGETGGLLKVGMGTGLAYAACNVPWLFTADARTQAVVAAGLCAAAMAMPLGLDAAAIEDRTRGQGNAAGMPFGVALPAFAAMIWLDSAAFFIIQHTPELKAGTWLGSVHLWVNGGVHFGAAVAAGALLRKAWTRGTLALAFGALGFACLLLEKPGLVLSASLFYPVGVSLYSVALVAYPAYLSPARTREERGRQAGTIYAVAGWVGSALGIGMGQNLGRVPAAFVAVAGVAVLGPAVWVLARTRAREVAVVGAGAGLALLLFRLLPGGAHAGDGAGSAVERGRQVYIGEGCISCHSQYVRPGSADVVMWGPVESVEEIRAQRPPLIGNRRQGPDLAEVGLRRSTGWLRAHLVDPAALSYRSPMPRFGFLFGDKRGGELVAYLASLKGAGAEEQWKREAAWQPSEGAWKGASAVEGERVYERECATCHEANGAARKVWVGAWSRTPPDLAALRTFARGHSAQQVAEVAKFGVAGTDMPGHEYLADGEIAAVTEWLEGGGVEK